MCLSVSGCACIQQITVCAQADRLVLIRLASPLPLFPGRRPARLVPRALSRGPDLTLPRHCACPGQVTRAPRLLRLSRRNCRYGSPLTRRDELCFLTCLRVSRPSQGNFPCLVRRLDAAMSAKMIFELLLNHFKLIKVRLFI